MKRYINNSNPREVTVKESLMIERLSSALKDFYADPNNKQAYEAWKKEGVKS